MRKGVAATDLQQPVGTWELWSDHRPIAITIYSKSTKTNNNGFITKRSRVNPKIINAAKRLFDQQLPKLLDGIAKINTEQKMDGWYAKFKDLIKTPWATATGRTPAGFKQFWNRTLDKMAKSRARLYRTVKRTNALAEWTRYNELETNIQNGVKKETQKSKDKLNNHLIKARGNEAISIVSKLLGNGKQTPERQTTYNIESKELTAHVATVDDTGFVPQPKEFEIDAMFIRDISTAIKKRQKGRTQGKTDYL